MLDTVELLRGIERLLVVACAPLLIFIGFQLCRMGVSGEMKITANYDKTRATITAVAPGSLCFLLGVLLGCYIMFSKLTVTPSSFQVGSTPGPTVSYAGGSAPSLLPLSLE